MSIINILIIFYATSLCIGNDIVNLVLWLILSDITSVNRNINVLFMLYLFMLYGLALHEILILFIILLILTGCAI